MEALHNDDDDFRFGVVQPAHERVVEPLIGAPPLYVGEDIVWRLHVIKNEDISAQARQRSADRGRPTGSVGDRIEVVHSLARPKNRTEDLPIESAPHDGAAVARVLLSELLAIARADHVFGGVMAQQPSDEGDTDAERFQVPRRQGDNQALRRRGDVRRSTFS